MTDGSIGQYEGEMKQPYVGTDFLCSKLIDWRQLSNDVVSADSNNFRFSLHAQGDGALSNVLDIYEKLRRDKNGKLLLRHAITDIECSDPADLKRMGKLGAIAEIYPQIMSVAHRDSKLAMIDEKIGAARGRNFWNRRKMADSGIVISCATDLPLLIDDIPESIYHSVGCRFPEGGEPFNPNNGLNIHELLTAWTFGGQHNLGRENELGTLDAGKLADIAVLDANVFDVPISQVRDVKVCLTIVDGKIVYSNL
jgi:predicted amidohydrolase YtcJ